jgi:tetratricopeptide (TPR) repeat protein
VVTVLLWTQSAPDADALWREAEEALQSGDAIAAAAKLDRLARLRSPNELDRLARAQVQLARGELEAALTSLKSIPDHHVMAAQARMLAGQTELRCNRLRPAEKYLRQAIALDPKLVQARKELIYIIGMQVRRRDLDTELRALSQIAPLEYDQVLLWSLTRGYFWDAKQHPKDLEVYVAADPDDVETRLAFIDLLLQGGSTTKAEELLQKLPADNPDARALRARLAVDRGQVDRAKALLAEGPADHPGLARLRGRLALADHDAPTAVKHFLIAQKSEPHDRDTLYGLGHSYKALNDESSAGRYLKAAGEQDRLTSLLKKAYSGSGRADPKMPMALATACDKAGLPEQAIAWCNIAISRDPLNEEAQQLRFRLQGEDGAKSAKESVPAKATGVAGSSGPG